MTSRAGRLVISLLSAVLLLAVGLGTHLFSCYMAPVGGCLIRNPDKERYEVVTARWSKPIQITLQQPELAYLGGSRGMYRLTNADNAQGMSSFIGNLPAVTPYELHALARHAVYAGKAREVVISIPYLAFVKDARYRPDFYPYDLQTERRFNPRVYLSMLESSFTPLDLRSGLLHWRHTSDRLYDSAGQLVLQGYESDCRRNNASWHGGDLQKYLEGYREYYGDTRHREIYANNLHEFEAALSFLQEEKIPTTLLVLPVHDSIAATRAMAGLTREYLDWVSDMARIASRYGVSRFLLYDGIGGFTDEAFSGRADCSSVDLAYWYNPSHAAPSSDAALRAANKPGTHGWDLLDSSALSGYLGYASQKYERLSTQCRNVEALLNNCFLISGAQDGKR